MPMYINQNVEYMNKRDQKAASKVNPEMYAHGPEIHHANDEMIKGFFDHNQAPGMIPGSYIAPNGQLMYPINQATPGLMQMGQSPQISINQNQSTNINFTGAEGQTTTT